MANILSQFGVQTEKTFRGQPRESFAVPFNMGTPVKTHKFSFLDDLGNMKPDTNEVVQLSDPSEKKELMEEENTLDEIFVDYSRGGDINGLLTFLDKYGRCTTKSTFWPSLLVYADRLDEDQKSTFEHIVIMVNVEFVDKRVRALLDLITTRAWDEQGLVDDQLMQALKAITTVLETRTPQRLRDMNIQGETLQDDLRLYLLKREKINDADPCFEEDAEIVKIVLNDGQRHTKEISKKFVDDRGDGNVLAWLYSCHHEMFKIFRIVETRLHKDWRQPTFRPFSTSWLHPDPEREWELKELQARWIAQIVDMYDVTKNLHILFMRIKNM